MYHLPLFLAFSTAHEDLHSFPTRRSSDLRRAPSPRRMPYVEGDVDDAGQLVQRDHVRHRQHRPRRMRSEEHTSELQSLTNLVCRLLLEKKKKNKVIEQLSHLTEVDTCQQG